jgi:hypothetical protein
MGNQETNEDRKGALQGIFLIGEKKQQPKAKYLQRKEAFGSY